MYPFLKLREGSNVVRAIHNPFQYFYHTTVGDNRSAQQKIKCLKAYGQECGLCQLHPGTYCPRWIIPFINRKDHKIYLLDVGLDIFERLRKFYRSDRWGDPQKYDVDIVMDESSFPVYQVEVKPPTPFTARERALKDSLDLEQIKGLTDFSSKDLTTIERIMKLKAFL